MKTFIGPICKNADGGIAISMNCEKYCMVVNHLMVVDGLYVLPSSISGHQRPLNVSCDYVPQYENCFQQ